MMKKSNKKRQILAATLILALAAAVGANWYYARLTPETGTTGEAHLGDSMLVAGTVSQSPTAADDETAKAASSMQQYFSEARLKKAQYHDAMEDAMETALDSEKLDAAANQKVLSLLSDLDTAMKAETDCENLIAAKLGGDCVVVIHDGEAQVVVESGRVSEDASMQIAEIVEKTANIGPENLTITEAK